MITTILRTLILYFFVILGIRLMGKRQIADMQPNELVITLLISEIAAIPLQDTSQPLLNGITAIFMLVILEILMSVLGMKSVFMRKIMSGKSVVVIKNGVIDQNAMKRVRLTILDLVELLRAQNIFDISKVAFAVLEVNGNLSVLLNSCEQPATAGQLNVETVPSSLPIPVISDGKILKDSLIALEINNEILESKLKSKNVQSKDVFLMTLDRNDNINLVKRNRKR